MTDAVDLVREVSAARERLIEFVARCSAEQWCSSPLADGDPRPVGVIVDHVADAYDYLGSFVTKLLKGEPVEVSPEIVDQLNARHASEVAAPTRKDALAHVRRSGDAFMALIEPWTPSNWRWARVVPPGSIRSQHATPTRIGRVQAALRFD